MPLFVFLLAFTAVGRLEANVLSSVCKSSHGIESVSVTNVGVEGLWVSMSGA